MFTRHDNIYIMSAAQAVIEHRQQAVGVRRKINACYIRLLADDMVEKARVLMGETIVILLPDVRAEQVVQRGNLAPPRKFGGHLQPFRMLSEHRIDDANEPLIAVEQTMASGQQIAFEPPLALMLAEHAVEDPTLRGQKFVVLRGIGIPLPVGNLKHCA